MKSQYVKGDSLLKIHKVEVDEILIAAMSFRDKKSGSVMDKVLENCLNNLKKLDDFKLEENKYDSKDEFYRDIEIAFEYIIKNIDKKDTVNNQLGIIEDAIAKHLDKDYKKSNMFDEESDKIFHNIYNAYKFNIIRSNIMDKLDDDPIDPSDIKQRTDNLTHGDLAGISEEIAKFIENNEKLTKMHQALHNKIFEGDDVDIIEEHKLSLIHI